MCLLSQMVVHDYIRNGETIYFHIQQSFTRLNSYIIDETRAWLVILGVFVESDGGA